MNVHCWSRCLQQCLCTAQCALVCHLVQGAELCVFEVPPECRALSVPLCPIEPTLTEAMNHCSSLNAFPFHFVLLCHLLGPFLVLPCPALQLITIPSLPAAAAATASAASAVSFDLVLWLRLGIGGAQQPTSNSSNRPDASARSSFSSRFSTSNVNSGDGSGNGGSGITSAVPVMTAVATAYFLPDRLSGPSTADVSSQVIGSALVRADCWTRMQGGFTLMQDASVPASADAGTAGDDGVAGGRGRGRGRGRRVEVRVSLVEAQQGGEGVGPGGTTPADTGAGAGGSWPLADGAGGVGGGEGTGSGSGSGSGTNGGGGGGVSLWVTGASLKQTDLKRWRELQDARIRTVSARCLCTTAPTV